jgi:hypothetical protein
MRTDAAADISLVRALPEEHRVDAILALAKARTPDAVGGWFDQWIQCLDFPTPPFTRNDTLRPIIKFSELASDGYMMRHCIANYAEDIMAGAACVYHWSGAQQATILLRRGAAGLWQIESRLHQLVFVKLRQKWLVGRLTRKKLHPSSFVFAL